MLDRLRKIGALLLIGVLLTPLIIKDEHHHHSFVCNASHHEKHFHTQHPKCLICAFDFSLFSLTEKMLPPVAFGFPKPKNDGSRHFVFFTTSDYSFLLRAPPIIRA